jgi:glucose/arabinose dehydrogenase
MNVISKQIILTGIIHLIFSLNIHAQNPNNVSVRLKQIATDLNSPVAMGVPNDGTNRIFIAEQSGKIKIIENGKLTDKIFLDLKSKMVKLNGFYDERGLLGIAFHPAYKTNRKFYVYYSAPSSVSGSNHKSIVAEYKCSSTDKNSAETTEKILMQVEQPESNHNGGQLAFGPDGYLYIALGDGGGAGDEHGEKGNGQNLNTLLGKILRIDVNANPYKVPADNPFVGKNAKPEIWAYGLRNPWRFSFDKKNGKLFCADVGQNEYEEVNIIEKGKNYGWRIMEGNHCFSPETNCDKRGLTLPVDEYDHKTGQSVTGGFVYRGNIIFELSGKYIFGDWTGPLFYLTEISPGKWKRSDLEVISNLPAGRQGPKDLRILSFGQDEKGELYILTSEEITPKSMTGSVYKIIPR